MSGLTLPPPPEGLPPYIPNRCGDHRLTPALRLNVETASREAVLLAEKEPRSDKWFRSQLEKITVPLVDHFAAMGGRPMMGKSVGGLVLGTVCPSGGLVELTKATLDLMWFTKLLNIFCRRAMRHPEEVRTHKAKVPNVFTCWQINFGRHTGPKKEIFYTQHVDKRNASVTSLGFSIGKHEGGGIWIHDEDGKDIMEMPVDGCGWEKGEKVPGIHLSQDSGWNSFDAYKIHHMIPPYRGERVGFIAFSANTALRLVPVKKKYAFHLGFQMPKINDKRFFRPLEYKKQQDKPGQLGPKYMTTAINKCRTMGIKKKRLLELIKNSREDMRCRKLGTTYNEPTIYTESGIEAPKKFLGRRERRMLQEKIQWSLKMSKLGATRPIRETTVEMHKKILMDDPTNVKVKRSVEALAKELANKPKSHHKKKPALVELSKAKAPAGKSPEKVLAESSKAKAPTGKSPEKVLAEPSKVKTPAGKSPEKVLVEPSKVKVPAGKSPDKVLVEPSKVKAPAGKTPEKAALVMKRILVGAPRHKTGHIAHTIPKPKNINHHKRLPIPKTAGRGVALAVAAPRYNKLQKKKIPLHYRGSRSSRSRADQRTLSSSVNQVLPTTSTVSKTLLQKKIPVKKTDVALMRTKKKSVALVVAVKKTASTLKKTVNVMKKVKSNPKSSVSSSSSKNSDTGSTKSSPSSCVKHDLVVDLVAQEKVPFGGLEKSKKIDKVSNRSASSGAPKVPVVSKEGSGPSLQNPTKEQAAGIDRVVVSTTITGVVEKKEASTQTESISGAQQKGVRRSSSVPGEKQLPIKIEQNKEAPEITTTVTGVRRRSSSVSGEKQLPISKIEHNKEAPEITTTVTAAPRNAILNKGKTAVKVPGHAVVQFDEALVRFDMAKQKKKKEDFVRFRRTSKEPPSKTTIMGKETRKKRVQKSPTAEKKKRKKSGGPAPGFKRQVLQPTTREGEDSKKQPMKKKIQLTMDYFLNRAANGGSSTSASTSSMKPQRPEEFTNLTAPPRKHRKRLSMVPRVRVAVQRQNVGSLKNLSLLEMRRASMARARTFRHQNRQ